jgi:hypothetical protein
MDGDEGEDVQRDSIYANERIPPFANSRQRSGGILIKLRDLVEGETAGEADVSGIVPKTTFFYNVRRRAGCAPQLFVQGEDELKNG